MRLPSNCPFVSTFQGISEQVLSSSFYTLGDFPFSLLIYWVGSKQDDMSIFLCCGNVGIVFLKLFVGEGE